jgi:diguanylate cyclase (GGDEF)-like protein
MSAELYNLTTRKNIGSAKDLLQSLVPRAQSFCFYDPSRARIWSSEAADDFEVDSYICDLPDDIVAGEDSNSELLRKTLSSGRTLLVLPVYNDTNVGLGLLVCVFSMNAGKSSSFNPSLLVNILKPALQIIGEVMNSVARLSAVQDRVKTAEKELTVLYQIDEKIHGSSKSHSSLAQLTGQSGRFLGISYSVLLLPSKRIRISATHSSGKQVNRDAVDQYLIGTLLPKLEGQRAPVIFDVPPVEGADSAFENGFQAMVCPLLDRNGNVEGVLAQLGRVNRKPFDTTHTRFMSHIVRKVEYVIEQLFDSMTGLMNREGFEAQLEEARKTLETEEDLHQIIYFDLDNLQLVNDTFGHDAGDAVIKRFAQLLDEVLPPNAIATRLTGDVFSILLTHSTANDALKLTAQIHDDSEKLRYLQGDKSLQVTVSIGVAEFSLKKRDGAAALTQARIACESAKSHGRDRVEVYEEDNQSIIRRYDDMNLVSQIQKMLDGDGFELHAQPIKSLSGKDSLIRHELLLRMKDSEGNPISSGALFSAAERYKLMPQIDRWVVSRTLQHLGEHLDYLAECGAIFAINLSGQSLGDDDILKFIIDEIESSGIPTRSLCFEVTESAAVSNRIKAQAFIDNLRERGCRFSLDDFGAGLSSFAYLKNFKVDTLKIDGSFIRDIVENRISESMVAAITQVAKVMELETVAEYVETSEAELLITRLGVDFAQGHHIGMPTPLDGVLAEMTEQRKTGSG